MSTSDNSNILVFPSAEDVARAGAERFVVQAKTAIAKRKAFSVALAGGNTPRRMYELLASDDFKTQVDWSAVRIFFGDERSVPGNHPDSNYRAAYESLISRVPIPVEHVYAIEGSGDPAENAQLYEKELRSAFPDSVWPGFDLVLLGLGKDGHTASLFPETEALREDKAWVVANWVKGMQTWRITLTAPSICAAHEVQFMVTGPDKAPAVEAIIKGEPDPERYPAQLITPKSGLPTWLLDAEAASRLSHS